MDFGLIRTAHPRIIIQSDGASPPSSGTEVHWHVDAPDDLLFLGEGAGNIGTSSGLRCIGIGRNALAAQTSADDAVALGSGALDSLTTGSRNVAIGTGAGSAAVGSAGNTLVGYQAGTAFNGLDTGLVALGSRAAESLPEGMANTFVGQHSGRFLAGTAAGESPTTNNTALGWEALRGLAATQVDINDNTAIGTRTLQVVEDGTAGNTAVGSLAGALVSSGDLNTLVGYQAGTALTTGFANTLLGEAVGTGLTTGARNTLVGSEMVAPAVGTNDLIAIGSQRAGNAGQLVVVDPSATAVYVGSGTPGNWGTSSGVDNVGIGAGAMDALTSGSSNVAIGSTAASSLNTADQSVLIGDFAGVSITGASYNTIVGSQAGLGVTGARNTLLGSAIDTTSAADTDVIAIGSQAAGHAGQLVVVDPTINSVLIGDGTPGNWGTGTGVDKVVIGSGAGAGFTTANQIVAIGTNAATNVTADFDAVFVGYNAGGVGIGTGAQYNTGVGYNALRGVAATALGQANTCIGAGAGENIAASSANTLVGAFAGEDIGSGSNNTVVGYNSAGGAVNLTSGSRNVVIGSFTDTPAVGSNDVIVIGDMSGGNLGSLVYVDPGVDSVFIGSNTPGNYGTASGTDNVAVGDSAAAGMTTAVGSTVVGAGAAGTGVLSGDNNTFVGYQAGAGIGGFSLGQNSTVLGANAGALLSGGNSNTLLGQSAGGTVGFGFSNVMIGDGAGDQAVGNDGNRNIIIGSTSTAGGSDSDVIVLKMDTGFGSDDQHIVVDPNIDGVFMGGAGAGNWPTLSGTSNVVIGDAAGAALTTGGDNTFLGAGAGATGTTGTDNICIGTGADVPAAGTSNFLNIGGAFHGDLSNARFRIAGGSGAISGSQQGLVFSDGTAEEVKTITHGSGPDAQSSAANAITPDFSANQFVVVTLTENITTVNAPTAPPGTGAFKMILIQAAAGGPYTVGGWNATYNWPGGTAPTMSSGASAIDIIDFFYDGTAWYGVFNQDFQ